MTKKNIVLACSALLLAGLPLLLAGLPLWAQANSQTPGLQDEALSYIGMKLDDLYRRLGPPKSVHTARGGEVWQDDVVFVYNEGEFYIYRDRVWQVSVKSFNGVHVGDSKAAATLTFKENAREQGDYLSYVIPGATWPISIRVNFDANKISHIYIFRPDY